MAESGEESGDRFERAMAAWERAHDEVAAALAEREGIRLGEALIQVHEHMDRSEALFVGHVGRFDKSGEYRADGALTMANWLRWKCRLSGSAAAERVIVAQQLANLPQTQAAFASGGLGYQHVAVIARTAERVGPDALAQAETELLQAAATRDPGQLVAVAKEIEYRVDHAAALAEANRAYERRYLHLSEPKDGLVHLDGLLDAEGGATVKTALKALMPPPTKATTGRRVSGAPTPSSSSRAGRSTAASSARPADSGRTW